MWLASGKGNNNNNNNASRRNGRNGLVAVAIDKDKGSQAALKWATENLLTRGQTVILIHVVQRSSLASYKLLRCGAGGHRRGESDNGICRTCCNRELGSWSIPPWIYKVKLPLLFSLLIPGAMSVSKTAPDFCTVYVISKTKISSVKNASRLAQFVSPLKAQIHQMEQGNGNVSPRETFHKHTPSIRGPEKILLKESVDDIDLVK